MLSLLSATRLGLCNTSRCLGTAWQDVSATLTVSALSHDTATSQGGGKEQDRLETRIQDEEDPDVEGRKQAAVRKFMSSQFGGEAQAELAQLLQAHGVVVKGGQQQAVALLEALLAWKKAGSGSG